MSVIEEIEEIDRQISELIRKKFDKVEELVDEVNKKICPKITEKFGWEAEARIYEDYEDPTWKDVKIVIKSDVDCSDMNELIKMLNELRQFIDVEFKEYGKYVFFDICSWR